MIWESSKVFLFSVARNDQVFSSHAPARGALSGWFSQICSGILWVCVSSEMLESKPFLASVPSEWYHMIAPSFNSHVLLPNAPSLIFDSVVQFQSVLKKVWVSNICKFTGVRNTGKKWCNYILPLQERQVEFYFFCTRRGRDWPGSWERRMRQL